MAVYPIYSDAFYIYISTSMSVSLHINDMSMQSTQSIHLYNRCLYLHIYTPTHLHIYLSPPACAQAYRLLEPLKVGRLASAAEEADEAPDVSLQAARDGPRRGRGRGARPARGSPGEAALVYHT